MKRVHKNLFTNTRGVQATKTWATQYLPNRRFSRRRENTVNLETLFEKNAIAVLVHYADITHTGSRKV